MSIKVFKIYDNSILFQQLLSAPIKGNIKDPCVKLLHQSPVKHLSHTEMAQVVEILSHGSQGLINLNYVMAWFVDDMAMQVVTRKADIILTLLSQKCPYNKIKD